jgi:hypothetical protein
MTAGGSFVAGNRQVVQSAADRRTDRMVSMRRLCLNVTTLVLLALAALPALAQEAEAAENATTYNGLGLLSVLAGIVAVAVVGFLLAQREASADEDDLV